MNWNASSHNSITSDPGKLQILQIQGNVFIIAEMLTEMCWLCKTAFRIIYMLKWNFLMAHEWCGKEKCCSGHQESHDRIKSNRIESIQTISQPSVSMLSVWEELTLSCPVNHICSSQSWMSVRLCMRKRVDSGFIRVCQFESICLFGIPVSH